MKKSGQMTSEERTRRLEQMDQHIKQVLATESRKTTTFTPPLQRPKLHSRIQPKPSSRTSSARYGQGTGYHGSGRQRRYGLDALTAAAQPSASRLLGNAAAQ